MKQTKPTPASWPLTSIGALWHRHAQRKTNIQTNKVKTQKIKLLKVSVYIKKQNIKVFLCNFYIVVSMKTTTKRCIINRQIWSLLHYINIEETLFFLPCPSYHTQSVRSFVESITGNEMYNKNIYEHYLAQTVR